MGVSGGKVYNFVLQTDQGRQSFALPPGTTGKGLWLRIATNGAPGPVAVWRVFSRCWKIAPLTALRLSWRAKGVRGRVVRLHHH